MTVTDPDTPQDAAQVYTVMLVEDHASYAQALETVMDVHGGLKVVARVQSVAEAIDAAAALRPRIAVIDLDLAPDNGVEAVEEIRKISPGTACVVLSALKDDVEFGRAIQAGAAAALHKSIAVPDLLDVLYVVARGGSFLPAEETSRRLRALAAHHEKHWYAKILAQQLTSRERDMLSYLAQGKGNDEIARELVISPQTVQTHIRNLLGKLGVRSRLEAVVKALELGLVDAPNQK